MNTEQLRITLVTKLRAYERYHKAWMESSIFNEEARTRAEANLKQAREEYETARNNWETAVRNPCHA